MLWIMKANTTAKKLIIYCCSFYDGICYYSNVVLFIWASVTAADLLQLSLILALNGPHILYMLCLNVHTYMLCIWNSNFKADWNAWRQFCNAPSHHGIGLQEMFINSDTNQMQLRGGVRITGQLFSTLSLQCHWLYIH